MALCINTGIACARYPENYIIPKGSQEAKHIYTIQIQKGRNDTMTKTTVLDEVKTRMQKMREDKAAQLEEIRKKKAEAHVRRESAQIALSDAAERLDADAYETAQAEMHKAQTALTMCEERYSQLLKKKFISEAESDAVIDSLLEYENRLADDFRKAAADPLDRLAAILDTYRAAVKDTEATLTEWQQSIHPNFRTFGGTMYTDETTGERTDRSKEPRPVHARHFEGCTEAVQLENYLNRSGFHAGDLQA